LRNIVQFCANAGVVRSEIPNAGSFEDAFAASTDRQVSVENCDWSNSASSRLAPLHGLPLMSGTTIIRCDRCESRDRRIYEFFPCHSQAEDNDRGQGEANCLLFAMFDEQRQRLNIFFGHHMSRWVM
jgi:hypothetical protein